MRKKGEKERENVRAGKIFVVGVNEAQQSFYKSVRITIFSFFLGRSKKNKKKT